MIVIIQTKELTQAVGLLSARTGPRRVLKIIKLPKKGEVIRIHPV
jgi:hypothetical protein